MFTCVAELERGACLSNFYRKKDREREKERERKRKKERKR